MNSLPFYETHSHKLNKIIRLVDEHTRTQVLETSFSKIKEEIRNLNGDILLATGNPKIKITKVWMNKVYDLLAGKSALVYKRNKSGYYSHPLYSSTTFPIVFERP